MIQLPQTGYKIIGGEKNGKFLIQINETDYDWANINVWITGYLFMTDYMLNVYT